MLKLGENINLWAQQEIGFHCALLRKTNNQLINFVYISCMDFFFIHIGRKY